MDPTIAKLIAEVGLPVVLELIKAGAKPGRSEHIPLHARERVRSIIGERLRVDDELSKTLTQIKRG